MEQILINPMSLVGMTTYHTKNLPGNIGVSFGLLYALQQQLTYKLSMTSPIGTNTNTINDLINNMINYQNLRLRKGWYVMGSQKYVDQKIFNQLNRAFQIRGAPYSLYYYIGNELDNDPKLIKGGRQIRYKLEMDPLQKYCVDALSFQQSKKDTVLGKILNKQKHLLQIYNEKLNKLIQKLSSTKNQQIKRKILSILESYDRMEIYNRNQKDKTIQAMNYSILTGLILTYQHQTK